MVVVIEWSLLPFTFKRLRVKPVRIRGVSGPYLPA